MKKLNEVKVDSNSFELINDSRCPRQLYRVNEQDQYALCFLDESKRIFRFESSVFTELLGEIEGGVTDVTLVESTVHKIGACPKDGFEIRLYLGDGTAIGIFQNDNVRFYLPTEYKQHIEDLSSVPVTELWNLPPDYPFDFLEMSLGLKKQLEPYISKMSPSEVIYRLWRDYLNCLRDEKMQPEADQTTLVHGVFGDFLVIESSDRRVFLQHIP
jgi:hypothetical protein